MLPLAGPAAAEGSLHAGKKKRCLVPDCPAYSACSGDACTCARKRCAAWCKATYSNSIGSHCDSPDACACICAGDCGGED